MPPAGRPADHSGLRRNTASQFGQLPVREKVSVKAPLADFMRAHCETTVGLDSTALPTLNQARIQALAEGGVRHERRRHVLALDHSVNALASSLQCDEAEPCAAGHLRYRPVAGATPSCTGFRDQRLARSTCRHESGQRNKFSSRTQRAVAAEGTNASDPVNQGFGSPPPLRGRAIREFPEEDGSTGNSRTVSPRRRSTDLATCPTPR